MGTVETENNQGAKETMTPLEMHKKMFPQVNLNWYQQDLLEVEITDENTWGETLKFWLSNDYRGHSIGKMIDYYKQKLEERKKGGWQDVGKWDGEETEAQCKTCFDLKKVMHFPNPESIAGAHEIDCECVKI